MTDTEKKIAEIREALENCTFPANERLIFVESEEDETTYEIVTERGVVIAKGLDPYDAYLFANAPEWLGFLLSEYERSEEFRSWAYENIDRLQTELDQKDEENRKLRQELEEAKAEAELEGQIADDANSDLNEALEENEQLRQERDMYKSSSEVFYERLKKVDEEWNRLFERLKVIKTLLGGVTFTDGRQWGAYNALCDIVEDIEKELSK